MNYTLSDEDMEFDIDLSWIFKKLSIFWSLFPIIWIKFEK
jgi:hypothetical protein